MASFLSIPLNFAGTCCGTCTSYCFCKTLTSSCQVSNTIARYIYLFQMFLLTFLAFILQHYGQPLIIHTEWKGIQYTQTICDYQCIGEQVVYRISFILCCYFMFLSLCTSTMSNFSTTVQTKYWFVKLFTLISGLVCIPFIPDTLIDSYTELCKYSTTLFLLIQMCILIDFGYTFNEKLISYGGIVWKGGIVTISLGLYTAMSILLFKIYESITYAILILISNVFLTCLSLSPIAPHGTLLTSSIVSFQVAYSYLIGNPQTHQLNSWISGFITASSLAFTAHSTSNTNIFHINDVEQANELVLLDSIILEDDETSESKSENMQKKYIVSAFYHTILTLSSMYMPILLIGLRDSHWEIITSQVFCILVYAWTLVAPSLFPDRDFS